MRKVMMSCAALAACFASSSAAVAGTATAKATVSITVTDAGRDCTITGAVVDLGTYRSTDTLGTVAGVLGYLDRVALTLHQGALGIGTVNLGTVTCPAGANYTVGMKSDTRADGATKLDVGNGAMAVIAMVKKIGEVSQQDGQARFNGLGRSPYGNAGPLPTAIGTGKAQPIMGNTIVATAPGSGVDSAGYLQKDTQLGKAGVYTGGWVSSVNF